MNSSIKCKQIFLHGTFIETHYELQGSTFKSAQTNDVVFQDFKIFGKSSTVIVKGRFTCDEILMPIFETK